MGQGDGEAPAAPRTVSRHPPGPHITTDSRPAPHREGHPPANSAVCVCVGRRSAVKATGSVSLHPRRCGHMGDPLPRAPHPLVVQIVR